MPFVISTSTESLEKLCPNRIGKILADAFGGYLDELSVLQSQKLLALVAASQFIPFSSAVKRLPQDIKLPPFLEGKKWGTAIRQASWHDKLELTLAIISDRKYPALYQFCFLSKSTTVRLLLRRSKRAG